MTDSVTAIVSSLYFFNQLTRFRRDRKVTGLIKRATEKKKGLVCAACRHAICTDKERIQLNGQHCFSFVNPAGIEYEIGVFSDAVGCERVGRACLEHSWFPGYGWMICLCGHCNFHLGWHYEKANDQFFGLVLRHLKSP